MPLNKILARVIIVLDKIPIEFMIKEYMKRRIDLRLHEMENIINGQIVEYLESCGLNIDTGKIRPILNFRFMDIQELISKNISNHITFVSNDTSIELEIEYVGDFIHVKLTYYKDWHVIQ